MKSNALTPLIVIILALSTLLVSLGGIVQAHEDPAEAARRANVAELAEFRSLYRSKFMLASTYPVALRQEILDMYPGSVSNTVHQLSLFGTPEGPKSKQHRHHPYFSGHRGLA